MKACRFFSFLIFVGAAFLTALRANQPSVVLIVCDDLNDFITGIPGDVGHPQVVSPNVDALAASGVAFRHAYANSPICGPSRSSFLTGIYPHHSGVYMNLHDWTQNSVLSNSNTLMYHFNSNGYAAHGSGKLMHHQKEDEWDLFLHKTDYGPYAFDGNLWPVAHPSVPWPFSSQGSINGSFSQSSHRDCLIF